MKIFGVEKISLNFCVSEVQHESIVLTIEGKPMAIMIGIDAEQSEQGSDDSFRRLIEERRSPETVSRNGLEYMPDSADTNMKHETDRDGVIRVGDTRVTLDSVISSFKTGATAEEIACQYPTLQLADIYSAISCYLRNQKETESYLARRRNIRDHVRSQNQLRFESDNIKTRLMARRTE